MSAQYDADWTARRVQYDVNWILGKIAKHKVSPKAKRLGVTDNFVMIRDSADETQLIVEALDKLNIIARVEHEMRDGYPYERIFIRWFNG